MTVDVYRPPAPLGPRLPLWVRLVILWAAMVVVYGVIAALLAPARILGPHTVLAPEVAVLLLTVGLLVSVFMVYAQLRLASDQSILARVAASRGAPMGDTQDLRRPSDAEERKARRLLRRGAITRREYEKVIARRRFVHGEITHAEYESIVRQLEQVNTDERQGARAPPGFS